MPGITISTSVRTGPVNTTARESSQAFFAGRAMRGPSDVAQLVTSMEDFELKYGTYVSGAYLHPTVQAFFEEGGSQCWIARGIHASATSASLALTNSSNTRITLTAVGGGDWSTDEATYPNEYLQAKVADGTASGTKVVTLYKGGQLIMSTGNCTTNQQIAGKINTHPVAKLLVEATVTAGYETSQLVAAPTSFTAGTSNFSGSADGGVPTDANYISALDLFLDSLGTGAVVCPETQDINDELIAHANTYNRIALLTADSGLDPNDSGDYDTLIALSQGIQGGEHAEHVAFYYPWVYVPTTVTGVNRLIPPTGYAAGARARAHNAVGPHQPGAGAISAARFVNGVEYAVGSTVGDSLDSENINAIRVINNAVRIYGARSCSGDTANFRYISAQDVLNHVVVEANRTLEDVLFTPIDGRNEMFVNIRQRLQSITEELRRIGALYEAFDVNGNRIDYGYTVRCDASLNPLSQLIDGTVTARVGIRVTSIGDTIQVDIVKSNLTASVV